LFKQTAPIVYDVAEHITKSDAERPVNLKITGFQG
jgi:hypothetical protein